MNDQNNNNQSINSAMNFNIPNVDNTAGNMQSVNNSIPENVISQTQVSATAMNFNVPSTYNDVNNSSTVTTSGNFDNNQVIPNSVNNSQVLNNSMSAPVNANLAKATRLLSPGDNTPTFLYTSSPLNKKLPKKLLI